MKRKDMRRKISMLMTSRHMLLSEPWQEKKAKGASPRVPDWWSGSVRGRIPPLHQLLEYLLEAQKTATEEVEKITSNIAFLVTSETPEKVMCRACTHNPARRTFDPVAVAMRNGRDLVKKGGLTKDRCESCGQAAPGFHKFGPAGGKTIYERETDYYKKWMSVPVDSYPKALSQRCSASGNLTVPDIPIHSDRYHAPNPTARMPQLLLDTKGGYCCVSLDHSRPFLLLLCT